MKSLRQLGCLGLFSALAGLAFLLAWGLLGFSTPRPAQVAAGHVQDFPVDGQPHLISKKSHPFYIVNIDGELIALEARSEDHIVRCIVHWQAGFNAFVDPCLGTHFSLRGVYRGKGPPGELRHLPLQIRGDEVWVETGYE